MGHRWHLTCRNATIVKGARLRDEIIDCWRLSEHGGRITFPVTSCSSYDDKRLASLPEMEEIAWVLRTDARRNTIGFVRPKALPDEERHALSDNG